MEQDNHEPILQNALFVGGLIVAGYYLSTLAFSKRTRAEIRERDGSCQWEGESGEHFGILEAAHYDHDKDSPMYDDVDNGRLLCTQHHLQDHIENADDNGLNVYANEWAIDAIMKRLGKMLSGNW